MKGTVRRKKETTNGSKNLTNGRAMFATTDQRGITLIALIITIIVMLILVAVTVTTVVNSGLFGKAGEAAQKWANAQEQENSLGDGTYVSDMVNQYTNGIENSGGNGGGTTTPEPEVNPLKVGDYVDYTPDTASSYSLQAIYSGYTSDQTIPQESLKWRVLSINSDGTVDIVSESPTTTYVYFSGALGYNNGVYLMNDICKKQYSNSTLGTTARSVNLEDIESKMNATGIAERDAYNNGNKTYGETQTYTGSNAYTPDIYTKVAQTTAGETSNYYTSPTTNTYTQQSSLTVKSTYYYFTSTPSNYFDDTTFHTLVFGTGSDYWLASRYASCSASRASFGLRFVDGAYLSGDFVFNSSKIASGECGYLRPVVSLGSVIQVSGGDGTSASPWSLSKN